ncbi:MAG TPA: ADOP family duplicated permease [Longimicrobiales bacterium]|nr:ADOP family duplicated permease [Longimicrobiales bacterium]
MVPKEDRPAVLSALDELYGTRVEGDGATEAGRWYRRQVRGFVIARMLGEWEGTRGRKSRMDREVAGMRDWLSCDLRFAWRQLRRHPATTLVALLVLVLGVGASAAVFTIVDGVVLAPLPFAESERLVRVRQVMENGAQVGLAPPAHLLFAGAEMRTLDAVAVTTPAGLDLEGEGTPEHLPTSAVSHEFFDVLRTQPALGRTFTAYDDREVGSSVVVLSHRLWSGRFASDSMIVGRTIRLGGTGRTVIGVMPRDFDFPEGTAAWLPIRDQLAGMEEVWGALFLDGIGRLRGASDPVAASAELSGLLGDVPEADGYSALATSLHDELTADVRRPLLYLLGAVVLLLLVACANVGSLLLARSMDRRRELALRTALGATRPRLVAGFLTEGILVGLIAGAAGLYLASVLVDVLLLIAPGDLPRAAEVAVGGRTLAFTLSAALLTGVMVGLLPATQIGSGINAAIRDGIGTHTGSARGRRMRGALVVTQTAVTVVLLTGASLLVASFYRLIRQESGFDSRDVVAVDLSLPAHRYQADADLLAYYDLLLGRVRETPGIEEATVTRNLPMGGRNLTAGVYVPDGRVVERTVHVSATPGFLELMRTRIVRGRSYEEADVRTGLRPAVLSETLARGLFGEEDPLGKHIVTRFGPDTMEVVGVAQDVRFSSLSETPQPVLYRPLAHWTSRGVHLVVRSARPPADLYAALREAISDVSPDQPVKEVATMPALLARTTARPRFYALLLTAFAAVALTLSTLGLYGLMLSDVARQRRDIAIRLALGAQAEHVAGRIIARALTLTVVGVTIGLAATLVSVPLVEGLLFEVRARDPGMLGLAVLMLVLVALLAAAPAALRAARVHPSRELAG